MNKKTLQPEEMDRIWLMHTHGKTPMQIAEKIGRSGQSVRCMINFVNFLKDGRYEDAYKLIDEGRVSRAAHLEWAHDTLGLTLPERETPKDPKVEESPKEQDSKNDGVFFTRCLTLLSSMAQYTRLALENQKTYGVAQVNDMQNLKVSQSRCREEIAKLNDKLDSLEKNISQYNEALIGALRAISRDVPADVKDNLNANCDVIYKEVENQSKLLSEIAKNTRKRGL